VKLPVALTIAGSDSGGGAGIQADLKTFAALGVHGACAITAITAQNTVAVTDIFELPIAIIQAQIAAVVSDLEVGAAKTGMLASAKIIEAVAAAIKEHRIPNVVVDPVMVAKSGAKLLRDDAIDALRARLLPLAAVITPNLPEAEVILGRRIRTIGERREAARMLVALGPRAAVVKGGHALDDVTDVYWDGFDMVELAASRVPTANTHGSGCVFSAAIAAGLAKGLEPLAAVRQAKEFISEAIELALEIGHGHGPVNPMFRLAPARRRTLPSRLGGQGARKPRGRGPSS
jgi:hydroxymethylpyrimidine/phosphomethylpyrimidine kinase